MSPQPSSRRALTRTEPSATRAGTPSRTLRANRRYKGPYLVPSAKNGNIQIPCESALEALVATAFEFSDAVERFAPQPCVFDVRTGVYAANRDALHAILTPAQRCDVKHWYVDFQLTLRGRNHPVFVEVKPQAIADAIWYDTLAPRMAACEAVGAQFLLITDADLPEPLKGNVGALTRYRSALHDPEAQVRIAHAIQQGPCTIDELIGSARCAMVDVLVAIAQGRLGADLAVRSLGPDTRVGIDQFLVGALLSGVFARLGAA